MGPKNQTRVAFFMLSLARLRCHSKSSSSANSVVISPVLPPALDGVTWYHTYQILLSSPPPSKSPPSFSSSGSTCGGVPHHERWLDHRDHLVHCLCSEAGENDENDFKYSFVRHKAEKGS